jgi:hypothetical protein
VRLIGHQQLTGYALGPAVDPDLPIDLIVDKGETLTGSAIDLGFTSRESELDRSPDALVRIAVQKVGQRRRESNCVISLSSMLSITGGAASVP